MLQGVPLPASRSTIRIVGLILAGVILVFAIASIGASMDDYRQGRPIGPPAWREQQREMDRDLPSPPPPPEQ